MGCNDYNLHLDSSSGEQPTPEFKIYLDGVGVNGYSPTVDIVNSTSSSFQIQVNDIDGTELTSPIPKLDYITNNYVSNTSLASTLANYSTTSEIAGAYLKVDGSNADNRFTINGTLLADNGIYPSNSYFSYELKSGSSIGYDDSTQYIRLPGFNLTSGSSFVTLNTSSDKPFIINGSNPNSKIYYHGQGANKEVATIGDIGNGTITLTQGGVTKGTFTTNQSGNTTIDLDAGGGSITNPLVINSDNGLKNLSIGYNSDNELSIISTWLYNGTVPIPMPAYLIGGTSNPISLSNTSANHGLKTINLNYDSNTLGINSDNELYVLNPSVTYTAGTGIDITNDVISIDTSVVAQLSDIPDVSNFVTASDLSTTLASYVQSSSLATVATTGNYIDLSGRPNLNAYVTLDTTQTISGTKIFRDASLVHVSGSNTYNLFQRNVFGNIQIGNANDGLLMFGSGIRPSYNTNSLALYSDIPTVPTNISAFNNDSGYITNSALSGYATETWVSNQGYLTSSDISDMATQTWVGQQGYITGIASSDVTTALGYTPYNATNPNGFISGIDSTMVVSALGYTPYADSNPDGFISGITSTDVVNALGYTPYSSSNPNGYTSVVENTVSGWGFTKNVGTVTSVNNVQPDSNGNVTITPTITVIDGGNA